MNPVVELIHLSKTFPGVQALDQVDLKIYPGKIHALVGENGAGKSTLINLLSGVHTPDAGEVRVAGHRVHLGEARTARRLGIVTVHQEADLFPDLTVMENMGQEMGLPTSFPGWIDWRLQRQRTRAALQEVGNPTTPDVPAWALSPAQRQLVEIAAAVSGVEREQQKSAGLLILDEPTSSLSQAETQVLFSHLRRFRAEGTAILYVSHRLEEIFALADTVTVLRDGRHIHTGPSADLSREQLIRLMVGREVEEVRRRGGSVGPVRFRSEHLSAVDGSFADISLEVRSGEILGIYGLIGAGRTEWAQAVFGLRPIEKGTLWVGERCLLPRNPRAMIKAGLAYVPEDRLRQGLCRGLSTRANVVLASLRRLSRWGWLFVRKERQQAATLIEQLRVRLSSPEQVVGTLSGGNQQKVVLGRWLGCQPRVLVLDEPTRGVDVGAKTEIHTLIRQLAAQGEAIILISSELPEVLAQSDRIVVFREGRLVAEYRTGDTSAEEVAAAALPIHESGMQEGTPQEEQRQAGPSAIASWAHLLREGSLLVFILLFFLALHGWTGTFLSPDRIENLLTQMVLLSFCAVGVAVVLVSGGLDISLGALMALSTAVAGKLWEQEKPFALVVITAVLVGAGGGMVNAVLSLWSRVHPIVITLGTMTLYRGLTLWWLGEDVYIPPGGIREELFLPWLGVPGVTWAGLLFLVVGWLALQRTPWGREFYALGSNPSAAHRVSIEPRGVWLRAFTLQGALAGLAGLLYLAESGNLQPIGYEEKTLEAIAAAVVGGVAISGGRGSIWGVALGCLLLVSLRPACIDLHLPAHWQQTLVGSVLVLAVLADLAWRGRGQ
jgi:rhamnose transport system ATP-binding protein